MSSKLQYCIDKNLAHPPVAVTKGHLVLEVIMGSRAYGSNRTDSDYDIYGVCVPPLAYIFNHTVGIIPGFGTNPYKFEHYEQQHLVDQSSGKEFSFAIYSIVRYFDLLYGCNPNIVESLFVPQENVTHITKIGHIIRDNKYLFLSKLCVHKMRAYADSQMKKILNKNPIGKRAALIEQYGYDTKFASNLIRLAFETEQILLEKDLDVGRNSQTLIAIRNGEWPVEKLIDIYNAKSKEIESLVLKSDLQAKPDENKIKDLLLECLEIQYGKVSDKIIVEDKSTQVLKEIGDIITKHLGS